jgi:hypothetical protein
MFLVMVEHCDYNYCVYVFFFVVFGYLCFGDTYLLEVMLSK